MSDNYELEHFDQLQREKRAFDERSNTSKHYATKRDAEADLLAKGYIQITPLLWSSENGYFHAFVLTALNGPSAFVFFRKAEE